MLLDTRSALSLDYFSDRILIDSESVGRPPKSRWSVDYLWCEPLWAVVLRITLSVPWITWSTCVCVPSGDIYCSKWRRAVDCIRVVF